MKILDLQWKSKGLLQKLGVFNENLGIFNKNLGSPKKILESSDFQWKSRVSNEKFGVSHKRFRVLDKNVGFTIKNLESLINIWEYPMKFLGLWWDGHNGLSEDSESLWKVVSNSNSLIMISSQTPSSVKHKYEIEGRYNWRCPHYHMIFHALQMVHHLYTAYTITYSEYVLYKWSTVFKACRIISYSLVKH